MNWDIYGICGFKIKQVKLINVEQHHNPYIGFMLTGHETHK